MTFLDIGRSPNLLLTAMSEGDRALLAPHLKRVPLQPRHVMTVANQPIEHVYFPETGIASIVSIAPEAGSTEVGVFGRDGFSGHAILLGTDRTPLQTYMQVDGVSAIRIDADRLKDAVSLSASLQNLLLRYVQAFIVQTANSVVSNANHRIEARLARWLLMCHDRVDGNDIFLTHEFISMMISAQRTGVTHALHILEGAGAIVAKRGRITVADREKLEEFAGSAYGVPEAEYARLIAPLRRGNGAEPS
jgi:CRP-like cAMP-binding protein